MGVKKKLLVTGSNGLLGQKLVHLLKGEASAFNLIATSKGANRISDTKGYIYESLDITNEKEVKRVIGKHKPDVIIHTAAMTNVDECESKKELCRTLNVEAVKYLVSAAEDCEAHFIHLSTDFVFDGEDGPYKEDDIPNPLSYYGQSKLDAEKIVEKSKTSWAIVRTIIIYGIVEDMSRSNIVLWAKSALEKKQVLNIVNDQFRSPVLAEDLAMGCILIAEKNAEGIFHISGKDVMSIVELVKRVATYYNLDDSYIHEISSKSLNQAAKRPPRTGFILDKARTILGYEPHSFEEGIAILEAQLKAVEKANDN
ncbi:MAG: SDR family NAD(P)-dependent oxidoreductase [Bacteroidetes bacterium]|nr:MAG: SDR family NAD(P)-dependent oxidoreductase [Bacteroidota bacterium]MBL1145656.1 SDR family oxidoreductase [Bacteroidota bacterium]MCB0802281.1 SDR family oxidoreductase [Flavobacteriales bacterium]NOG58450.1 SDR family oxidoreductase [Bacteroidota bacterium]